MSGESLNSTLTGDAVIEPARVVAPRSRRASRLEVVWPPLVLGAAIIGIWYFISYVVLSPRRRFLLVPPHEVITDGFGGTVRGASSNGSLLWESFQRTAMVAAIGMIIAIVVGLVLAIIMSQSMRFERAIFPFAVMVQATPILALVPLIGFWFGFGTNARVIVCVLIAVFPVIVNTLFGLQSADRGMHDLFTLQGASRITRLRKLMFPAAMPAIFAGLRISAGLSVIGAIVGDVFFGQGPAGLGRLLRRAANEGQGALLLATVVVSCAIGVVVFLIFGWLGRRVTGRWYESTGN
jgi:NitT/TauT family transport system permease protein